MRLAVIGIVITVVSVLVEVALLIADCGEAAGVFLVFGIMASGLFRFLDEMEGGE